MNIESAIALQSHAHKLCCLYNGKCIQTPYRCHTQHGVGVKSTNITISAQRLGLQFLKYPVLWSRDDAH